MLNGLERSSEPHLLQPDMPKKHTQPLSGLYSSASANDTILTTEAVRKRMAEIATELNQTFEDTQVRFQYIDEINRFYVQIVSTQTGKVLSEIPSREMLDLALEMKGKVMQILSSHGVLVDRKA